MPPLHLPLSGTQLTLNAWGLAGVFGGEEAISAMTTTPLYHGKRWLGWYNSPGSLEVARHFGRLAYSRYSEDTNPFQIKSAAHLFGLDGRIGPRYIAALSGTEMQTGHLGHLIMERCKEIKDAREITGRITKPAHVVLIDLGDVDLDPDVLRLSKVDIFLAVFPIIVSVATCIMCALVYDWYSFSTILIGILASGFAGMTIGGSVKLKFKPVTNPALGSPPGDGILVPVVWGDGLVVVRGTEAAVDVITKGTFKLRLGGRIFRPVIVISALLLIVETLVQLFFIPQGTLFGQFMFVLSLCVSWACNFRISLSNRERLQAELLFRKLGQPRIRKFLVGPRTTMVVFVAFLVFHGIPNPSPIAVQRILRTFLPNDTSVWAKWRRKVARQVCDTSLSCLEFDKEDEDLTEPEKKLLGILLRDATAAFDGYLETLGPMGKFS